MIDGGPLRTSRPTTGRQVEYQDEPVRYKTEETQQVEAVTPVEQPRRVQPQRQAEPQYSEEPILTQSKNSNNTSWVKWLLLTLAAASIAVAGWLFWPTSNPIEATIDADKYQAVFLSNGQVYFGKLAFVNDDYMKLTNVYYLERQLSTATEGDENPVDNVNTQNGENNFQLLKYSDVLYGSEDAMVISKDDVIRYENLRSDGVVAKAIANRN